MIDVLTRIFNFKIFIISIIIIYYKFFNVTFAEIYYRQYNNVFKTQIAINIKNNLRLPLEYSVACSL